MTWILRLLLLILATQAALCKPLTFAVDPIADVTVTVLRIYDITGSPVKLGETSANLATNPVVTVEVSVGKHFITARAVNGSGVEAANSNVLTVTVPAKPSRPRKP